MAVQIRWKLLRLDLTSLEFSISRGLFQNQIHHGGTEGTEKYFSIWRGGARQIKSLLYFQVRKPIMYQRGFECL